MTMTMMDDGGVGAQECGDEDKRKDTEGDGHGMERLERSGRGQVCCCLCACMCVGVGWVAVGEKHDSARTDGSAQAGLMPRNAFSYAPILITYYRKGCLHGRRRVVEVEAPVSLLTSGGSSSRKPPRSIKASARAWWWRISLAIGIVARGGRRGKEEGKDGPHHQVCHVPLKHIHCSAALTAVDSY